MGDKEFWDKVEHMEPVAHDSAGPVEDVANPASPHSPGSPGSPDSPQSRECGHARGGRRRTARLAGSDTGLRGAERGMTAWPRPRGRTAWR